jgi:uncharacterized protein
MMIRRLLFLVLAAVGIFWMLRRRRPAQRAASPIKSDAEQGRMVRDRVCNKFLPRSDALVLQIGSEEHFFCSEACRERFRSG